MPSKGCVCCKRRIQPSMEKYVRKSHNKYIYQKLYCPKIATGQILTVFVLPDMIDSYDIEEVQDIYCDNFQIHSVDKPFRRNYNINTIPERKITNKKYTVTKWSEFSPISVPPYGLSNPDAYEGHCFRNNVTTEFGGDQI